VPNKIIGYSIGELGCAYADGCFTAEQMILFAYSKGLESIETKVTKLTNSMTAVDFDYEVIKDRCLSDIKIACHDAPDSSPISGSAELTKELIAQLQVCLTRFYKRKNLLIV